ncbi:DMT family transporter [Sphingomonas qomolangmaensis]|uniref:DMT family transporter n=1 Tax=Sphingomonas qomolangmaensis TaxID=2918765 RepID=A0ABY5L8E8_9SPHN|nr:DMT family transporter [Sphingomonas qomolangmaensis]UUL82127.1 DMT family transporter [Sphingomonas qomolangmaensis]
MSRPTPAIAAFLVACLGVATYSVMDVIMKGLVLGIGVYSAVAWRNLAGAVIAGTAWGLSRPTMPGRAALRLHAWRGVVVTFMSLLFFYSIGVLPIAEAIALSFIAPLIALYLAALLLGETIGRAAIVSSVIALAGVAVILAGRLSGSYDPEALLGVGAVLLSAVLFAYNLILARKQALIARPLEIGFFQTLTVLTVLALVAPWLLDAPRATDWPAILGAGVLAVLSLIAMGWAYARAEAQLLIPVEYTAFVWAAICGWLFFGEAVTWTTLAGTLLIVAGCILAARARPPIAEPVVESAIA